MKHLALKTAGFLTCGSLYIFGMTLLKIGKLEFMDRQSIGLALIFIAGAIYGRYLMKQKRDKHES